MHQESQQQQQVPDGVPEAAPQSAAAETGNAQRIPNRMLVGRRGNTDVRYGKCYILTRSQLDPRHPIPQFIDETYVDRNRLESLNFQILNPDIQTRSFVKCLCTRVISLRDDWYVHLHDGTILCHMCTRCFRCFTICFTAGRKLNSIDGLVLCNTCMLSYGCYRAPKLRLRLQPLPRTLGGLGADDNKKPSQVPTDTTASNAEDTESCGHWASGNNCNAEDTVSPSPGETKSAVFETPEKPRFRDEGRKPLREAFYPNPRPADYGKPDYRMEAPPYLGVDRNIGSQACPDCGKQALSQSLVVPGCARVYHERSFSCVNCKRQMHMGYQTPGAQFECCNCPKQPKIWCTSSTCRLARLAHHAEKKCHLAPVHPGGRPKRDAPGILHRFDPEQQRQLESKFLRQYNKQANWLERRKQLQQQPVEGKKTKSSFPSSAPPIP